MGVIHVLAGVDHLSALATLSVGSSWRAMKLGVRWGLGHSAGLVLVTVIFILLKGDVDSSVFKRYCDFLVGLFMIVLGIHSIYTSVTGYWRNSRSKLSSEDLNRPSSQISGKSTQLNHIHDIETIESSVSYINLKDNSTQRIVAFLIGIIHGIAGPGGMLGVIPAVEMKEWYASVLYLTSFTISSTLCMGAFAAIFGEATKRAGDTSGLVEVAINVFSSLLSIVVGATWIALSTLGKLDHFFGE